MAHFLSLIKSVNKQYNEKEITQKAIYHEDAWEIVRYTVTIDLNRYHQLANLKANNVILYLEVSPWTAT